MTKTNPKRKNEPSGPEGNIVFQFKKINDDINLERICHLMISRWKKKIIIIIIIIINTTHLYTPSKRRNGKKKKIHNTNTTVGLYFIKKNATNINIPT